jgi:hypothetical protein
VFGKFLLKIGEVILGELFIGLCIMSVLSGSELGEGVDQGTSDVGNNKFLTRHFVD